jgi:hypothetical protein
MGAGEVLLVALVSWLMGVTMGAHIMDRMWRRGCD